MIHRSILRTKKCSLSLIFSDLSQAPKVQSIWLSSLYYSWAGSPLSLWTHSLMLVAVYEDLYPFCSNAALAAIEESMKLRVKTFMQSSRFLNWIICSKRLMMISMISLNLYRVFKVTDGITQIFLLKIKDSKKRVQRTIKHPRKFTSGESNKSNWSLMIIWYICMVKTTFTNFLSCNRKRRSGTY